MEDLIKTEEEIEIIRQCGARLSHVLKAVVKMVRAGVTTKELDIFAERLIREAGGAPAFKGYTTEGGRIPFPTTLCISINNQVVHTPAVPSQEIENGDLLKIDIGMRYPENDGLYTDMAVTVPVGVVTSAAAKLTKATERALALAIKQVRPGNRVSDISKTIEEHIASQGFSCVRELVGHGVGRKIHEPPEIPNFWRKGMFDAILKPGMVLAIEPIVSAGGWRVKIDKDGWTIVTSDGSLSAHFEHTVIVGQQGCEVVTL